jgi:HK97 gp10 family phage protein
MVKFELSGADAILEKLKGLSADARRKAGRSALRKAAQIVRDDARQRASQLDDPETAANISQNIVERWSSRYNKQTGDLKFRVGVLGGAGGNKTSEHLSSNPGGDTRHWRYQEFGTEKMRAQPFMRPALESNISKATDVFVSEFERSINSSIKRGKK